MDHRAALILALLALPGGSTGCVSGPPVKATWEDGPALSQELADAIAPGSSEDEVRAQVGAEPNESKEEEDGWRLWVFAWARATADDRGKVYSKRTRTLSVWFKDGKVTEARFEESER